MESIFRIAVSGANAALQRVSVSARNVAGMSAGGPVDAQGKAPADAYRPQRVVQASVGGGGVSTKVVPVEPAFTRVTDADGTGLALPNVDLAAEMVEQTVATQAYKASLSLVRTADEMSQALFEVADD